MLIFYENLSLNTSAYLIISNMKWPRKLHVKFIMPLSILFYNVELFIKVYNNCSETHTNRLHVIQNKFLKLILKLDRFTPTNMLHKEINVLKVTHIGESSVLGIVNEIVRGHCPEIFHSYFEIKKKCLRCTNKGSDNNASNKNTVWRSCR